MWEETFSNLPPDLVKALMADGILMATPWLQWCLRNSGAIAANDLASPDQIAALSEKGRKAVSLVQRHGIATAQIISLRDSVMRTHGAVALNPHAGAKREEVAQLWSKSGHEIMAVSWVMHMRIAALAGHEIRETLTRRQREVLIWTSAGKTVAEIATILGLTRATVEKHLRLAREALDATSTAQAVLKAHLSNQLFLHDDENP